MTSRPKPVVLCILDGWGHREAREDNAIALGNTPVWDRLMAEAPQAFVETSGLAVGLPDGQMGNSEVGHMNIGGGRVVMQDLPRIDEAVQSGELAKNLVLNDLLETLGRSCGTLHLMGLISPGGVHSHQDHIVALAHIASNAGVPVSVHCFLDGRDTPPRSADGFVAELEEAIADLEQVRIATVSGRYYAMDRDKRWNRVERAYRTIVDGTGERAASAAAAVAASYAVDKGDEFVEPTVTGDYKGMRDGDGILMANFRADRAREIVTALVDPAFDGFERSDPVTFAGVAGMVEYSSHLNAFLSALFPAIEVRDGLGEVISRAGLRQLRISETEKYSHVTFFLNGGEEQVYEGEDRILIPSPDVATYDLKPEMSAPEVTDKLVEVIGEGTYDLIIVNYANGDMVGHTGILEAAMKAAETVDACLARLEEAVLKAGGTMLITADHGNAELMRDPDTGAPHTAHTVGKVPIVMVGGANGAELTDGALCDLAPTILALMRQPQPTLMTGSSLIDANLNKELRATA